MNATVIYSNSLLHSPNFSTLNGHKFGKPFFSFKGGRPMESTQLPDSDEVVPNNFSKNVHSLFNLAEIADKLSVSSIRADGNKREKPPQKNPSPGKAHKGGGTEDYSQSVDSKKPALPNKEEILAVFKRIQSSISRGESLNSKKSASKLDEDKPSAEAMLEVLFQSRMPGKGKAIGKKGDKFPSPRNDSQKKEKTVEDSSTMSLESPTLPLPQPSNFSRQPSNFMRKSPIPSVSSPRDAAEAKSETLQATDGNVEKESKKLEEMNLSQLKEVAKSKGIKGYSKLKKSELVELLIRS